MMYSNRALKESYLDLFYKDQVLPWQERSPKLPISSGNAFWDSCLFEKIRPSTSMSIEEHLLRSQQLIERANADEIALLTPHLKQVLNDHKILLAMRLFLEGNDEEFGQVFKAMPQGWRVQFPTAFIKPSEVFFTGWKRNLDFRLYEDIPYERLRSQYSKFLESVPEIVLLKYRDKIKTAMALLHYRVDSNRERNIADWCFDRKTNQLPNLPLINTFLDLRQKAKAKDQTGFGQILADTDVTIPITSYMGLLGTLDVELNTTDEDIFREYAVRCATTVETLLRLNEWDEWLCWNEDLMDIVIKRLMEGYEKGYISLESITKAYVNLDHHLKKQLTEPVFVPLLKKFSQQISALVPPDFEFIIPRSFFIFTNFLLYLVMNTVSKGSLTAFHDDEVDQYEFSLDILSEIVQMDYHSFDDYLHEHYRKEYQTIISPLEFKKIIRYVDSIPADRMLIVDLPFACVSDFIYALNKHSSVFNVHNYVGLSGEITMNPSPTNLITLNVLGEAVFTCEIAHPRDAVVDFVALLQKVKTIQDLHDSLGGATA